jgi:hypothetical protein
LVPRRYQSGEVDYIGSISKCGDRRLRTFLYEAANVMLTRYKGALKLKDWAFADRQTIHDAQGTDRARPWSRDHQAPSSNAGGSDPARNFDYRKASLGSFFNYYSIWYEFEP